MKFIKKLFFFFWDRSLGVFLIIGGLNTLLSYAISFALGYWAGWRLFAATATAYAICSVPSFYFNRKFSFKSKAPLGQSVFRFSVIITVCFLLSYALNNIVMPWARGQWLFGLSEVAYLLVRLLGIQVAFTLLNYVGQRLWAFTSPKKPPGGESDAE